MHKQAQILALLEINKIIMDVIEGTKSSAIPIEELGEQYALNCDRLVKLREQL
tara:strand:+ start:370 stop:528 length:159 start_codon:yes stop_codon:yes gene_type:complete